jgi:hypothetical protein
MTAETELISIGRLAERLFTPIADVEHIADGLRIRPFLAIDGLPHYRDTDAERIERQLRRGAAADPRRKGARRV